MERLHEENHNQLQIDNVLSSQPELGPNIPDGGYGWVVVVTSMFFHIMVPSISVGLGIFTLFSRVENGASFEDPYLWDNNMVYVAFFFITTWTITAPLSRSLSLNSTWPRLVSTAGTCLICAGLLLIWTTNNSNKSFLFALAGIFIGGGASIILTQIDIILLQYFKFKLEIVHTLMYVSEAIGFIITPIALGHSIIQNGIPHIITWYQAVILQGIILSIAFKKPKYLKSAKQRYRLVRGLSDEEEDVFAKNITELQNPRISQSENIPSNNEISLPPEQTTNDENLEIASNVNHRNWETFEEMQNSAAAKSTKTRTELHKTFALEFSNDLDRVNTFEDNYVEVPKPLFSESHINNNTSYSYEVPVEIDEPVVFMPNVEPAKVTSWRKALYVLKEPTFYKSLLFMVTSKLSLFIFWTLFPSYLYIKIDNFNVQNTSFIVGCISITSLIFAPLLNWIKSNRKLRPILYWIFCWAGAIGYLLFTDFTNKVTLLCGTITIILNINALQILGLPLLKLNNHGQHSTYYVLLHVITGLMLTLFLAFDMHYKNCFLLMSLLQFFTGSVWLSNFVYKKIKRIN